jgi:hypothetical protein
VAAAGRARRAAPWGSVHSGTITAVATQALDTHARRAA